VSKRFQNNANYIRVPNKNKIESSTYVKKNPKIEIRTQKDYVI